MGAFNHVKGSYTTPCCSNEQSDWQSKRAEVQARSGRVYLVGSLMQELHIEDISHGEMHTLCLLCEHFIACIVKDGEISAWNDQGVPVRRAAGLSS
jgi:hypothetical protein